MALNNDKSLKKYLSNIKENLEVEARLRFSFDNENVEKFLSFINQKDYTLKETYTVDYYKDSERTTKINDEYFLTSKKEIKSPKIVYQSKGSIKFTISEEKNVKTLKPVTHFMERKKKRKSFIRNNISIDITRVIETKGKFSVQKRRNKLESEIERWEIEVEVIDSSNFVYQDFIDTIEFVYHSLVDDIENIYLFIMKYLELD